eukprot:TRINITY_DN5608_c0_g1_i2.p1 TRINITY_DN5608_c0_g1~~TRINITY_DN5608_c0_g1_i2.p1  ORF type:complete len:306 (-),score=41.81 TRINITY_DN5608_c0_g1_i2:241-1158(-)
MASAKNDALMERTVEGSINYYDNHKCKGTAFEKRLATLQGGYTYNIINNDHRDEVYFPHMRHKVGFVDEKNRATSQFFGERRRRYPGDERRAIEDCFKAPLPHPREEALKQRRHETQLAQIENSQSWSNFQERSQSFSGQSPERRRTVSNKLYGNEAQKLNPRLTSRQDWSSRRGEPMVRALSAPSVEIADPAASLSRAVREDARKDATQRQTSSAQFAPWMKASTLANSLDATAAGRAFAASQKHCSINRLENYDFAVSRRGNHFSAQDKHTRNDGYYMPPRSSMTNNSVKYDIISNERRWFKY